MHLLSLKPCHFKTTKSILLLFFPTWALKILTTLQKVKTHKEQNNTPAWQFKQTVVTQFFSYTDNDKHTHLNMHCVKVTETNTRSALEINLSVISSRILLTWYQSQMSPNIFYHQPHNILITSSSCAWQLNSETQRKLLKILASKHAGHIKYGTKM